MIQADYPVPKAPWEYSTAVPKQADTLAVPDLTTGEVYDPSYQNLFDKLKPSPELVPGGTIYV